MYRQRTSFPRVVRPLLASAVLAFGCGFAIGVWTGSPSGTDTPIDLVAASPSSPAGDAAPPVLEAAVAPRLTRSDLPATSPRPLPVVRLPDDSPDSLSRDSLTPELRATPLPGEPPASPVPELHAALPLADPVLAVLPEPDRAADAARHRIRVLNGTARAGAAAEQIHQPDGARRTTTAQVTVRPGDTLLNILRRAGIDLAEAHAVVASLQEVYDPRRLRPGQEIALELKPTENGGAAVQLARLTLGMSFETDVRLSRDGANGFAAAAVDRPLRRDVALSAGSIDNSLYLAAIRSGLPEATLAEMIRVFSWDVDFQRDVQPEDRFEALFERVSTVDGSEVRGGNLLFASLSLSGRTLNAYRFERPDGGVDYFDRDGRSLRKSLLRTPIDGARLSSRFGPRRHPILGYTRMHRGIDFAAPTGTPIFAAGDGEIVMIGRNAGYGNYIRIRHNNEYQTAYAHLHGFARGLQRGSRIRQGQVIGYVGSTGMSTGPHLHYEVLRRGEQINPLSVEQTVADALTGAQLERFRAHVAEIDAERQRLTQGTRLASRAD